MMCINQLIAGSHGLTLQVESMEWFKDMKNIGFFDGRCNWGHGKTRLSGETLVWCMGKLRETLAF